MSEGATAPFPAVAWFVVPSSAAVVGVAAALAGQPVSPFHVPTHEFTQLFALIASVAVVLGAWLAARRRPEQAREVLLLTLASVVAMGAGVCGAQLGANALVHGCRMNGAIAFFWITWLPLGVFASVAGAVLGERGWSAKRVLLALFLVGLASATHDLLQGLAGVRVMDPLLGEPDAFDQRATMQVSSFQVYQRQWLVGLAAVIWAVRNWTVRRGDRLAARCAALLVVGFVAVTVVAGSHVGVGWGTGRLRSTLDAALRTPHFVLRYDPAGEASMYVEAISRQCEWQWHLLSSDWAAPVRPIEIRVYDDDVEMVDLTGMASNHAGPRRIDFHWRSAFTDTLPHELVHVFHLDRSWWRPSRWLSRGLVEGVAEAWADDLVSLPEAHRSQAAALRAGHLPALRQCMGLTGFWTVNEGAAYETAGSFIGWLVLEHGIEKFRLLDGGLDYERAYGLSLPELEAEWHAFLSGIEVDPDERVRARLQFDPEVSPAYVECTCPKLGTRTESREEVAERRLSIGDYDNALALYRLMLEAELGPEPSWALNAALCLQRLGRAAEALPLLEGFEANDLPADDVDQLLTRRIVSLMAMRDWEALYAALDERTRRAAGSSPERRVTEECLRDPVVRDEVARALAPENGSMRIEKLERLANAHPDRRCVLFLAEIQRPSPGWSWWPQWLDAPARERARALLQYVRDDPSACALFAKRLGDRAENAIYRGDLKFGEELARGIAQSCPDPIAKHRAARCLARIEWERNPDGELTTRRPTRESDRSPRRTGC